MIRLASIDHDNLSRRCAGPAESDSQLTRQVRALVCDDEGLTCLRLELVLQSLGFDVVGIAPNGDAAVRQARELRPDVILMDIRMPNIDGIEATRRIMREAPSVIVMLTAFNETKLVQQALEAGASGFLVKPVRDDQLLPAISVALSQRGRTQQAERKSTQLADETTRLQSSNVTHRRAAEEAQQQVVDAVQQTRELERRFSEERRAARVLAESLLSPVPAVPGYDLAAVYEPAIEAALIGGDYYDFLRLESNRLALIVGDACGKGASAAAYMAQVRYMTRAFAWEDPSPASVLGRLNQALCAYSEGQTPSFITMVYAVLDLETRRVTYGNGGHPEPLVYCAGRRECRELGSTGGLIGALKDMQYGEASLVLEPASILALFTDGITEARSGSTLMGSEGVGEILARSAALGDAGLIARQILDSARNYSDGKLRDDAAVVVLRA